MWDGLDGWDGNLCGNLLYELGSAVLMTLHFFPGNSTADGDNFMGCGDQELPEAPPEVPTINNDSIPLNPLGVWFAQGAWSRERFCGKVGI